jgi:hypothetical protein
MGNKLILLFGMPRSGTTWLGKILDSHPDTYYLHEPDSKFTLDSLPLVADKKDAENYRDSVEKYLDSLLKIYSTKVLSKLPIFPKSYYSKLQYDVRYFNIMFAKAITRTISEFPIFPLKNLNKVSQLHVVWKSIESSGRLGVLTTLFPDIKCVYVVRHPCGYVASVIRGEGKGKFESATKSSEDYGIYNLLLETEFARRMKLTIPLIKALKPMERLALRWLLFNEKVLEDLDASRNCIVIRYEDVCEKPVVVIKSVFEKIGLQWSSQTEQFVQRSTSDDNDGYYSVIKDPKIAASKWKEQLSGEEISQIYNIVKGSRCSSLYQIS